MKCKVGDWVQIHSIVLQAGERAPQVPEETQRVPMEMWCKGFANGEAKVGETVTITTVVGRVLTGKLTAINPRYGHDFGAPIPELLRIGLELRKKLYQGGQEAVECNER